MSRFSSNPLIKISVVVVGFTGENVATESLLPIVASQRERFKVRNMELEAVSYSLYHSSVK